MVILGLQIKANLENVTNLSADGDDFRWYFKLKCGNCHEVSDKWQYLTSSEKSQLPGSRGEANFVAKCKLCSRENSIDIMKDSCKSYSNSNKFATIVQFDCRGTEPVEFEPRIGWKAEGVETSTKFSDINLSEKEWADYDEKKQEPVGIYDFEYRFVKL